MDPKTPKATALERAKQFGARAVQEVVKPTGKVLLGMAQELGKAPIKAAMAPTDILSIAATGKPLPPLKVPGLGEVSSYGRRAVELQKELGYTPAIAALQAGSEGVLDIASAGQIGALARAARGAVAAPKVSPAKTNVLQERLGTARDAITRSMTRSIREPSMGLSIKRVGTSADNLTSEARKYKSAEEFVDSKLPITRRTVTLMDKGTPRIYMKQVGGEWTETITGAKILDKGAAAKLDQMGEEQFQPVSKIVADLFKGENAFIHDGGHLSTDEKSVLNKMLNEGIVEKTQITNPYSKTGEKLTVWKLKSQLTDIWNKAQSGSRGKTNALKKKIDTE